MPHVVAIGGGHGLSIALAAAARYATEVTAVVSVADDGGSSGRLLENFYLPPPGDLRTCLLALSPPGRWRDVMDYRFDAGELEGHSAGNLILTALTEVSGGMKPALETAGALLDARGRVLPAAEGPAVLEAEIGGRLVVGQARVGRTPGELQTIRLAGSPPRADPDVLEAIAAADQILIGPGSLYTSVISALLTPGLAQALREAPCRKIFICNTLQQDAETLNHDAADHVDALVRFAGVRPDVTVVQKGLPAEPFGDGVAPVHYDGAPEAFGVPFRGADMVNGSGHDVDVLARVLLGLV
jgi:uncharacterized cofD-like protein